MTAVDPDALAEALAKYSFDSTHKYPHEGVSSIETAASWPDDLAGVRRRVAVHVPSLRVLVAAARAFLEAPTELWCGTHDEPKLMGHGGSAHVEDDTCEFGRVRLVAESQPDTPT